MANPRAGTAGQQRAQQNAMQQSRQRAGRQDFQNLGTMGSIAKQGYDIEAIAPDPINDMADMVGKSAQTVTGGRPAHGWRALISGLLEGASAGLKGKVSQEKKEKAEKMGRVFEWLEANGMAMAEKNKQNNMKMQAEEELSPLLKDYAQNMGTMAPLAKEKYVEHILGRLNETTGSDYELSSIDQVNPLKVTVRSPKNGNSLFVHDFSKQVGGVNADLYQKAVDFENQKFNQENQRIDLARQNTELRWSAEKQVEVGLGKKGLRRWLSPLKKPNRKTIRWKMLYTPPRKPRIFSQPVKSLPYQTSVPISNDCREKPSIPKE
jgi:hypothetical protein